MGQNKKNTQALFGTQAVEGSKVSFSPRVTHPRNTCLLNLKSFNKLSSSFPSYCSLFSLSALNTFRQNVFKSPFRHPQQDVSIANRMIVVFTALQMDLRGLASNKAVVSTALVR